jgi:hypothetical protein
MNKNGKALGYKRDNEYKTFSSDLLLSNFITKMKTQFVDKIKESLGKDQFSYQTQNGKVDLVIKTDILHKYFVNGHDFTGKNYSLITVEFSNINILKDDTISDSPVEQKYYKFKNWLLTEETKKAGILVDNSFIVGRSYGKDKLNFNHLYKNTSEYPELLKSANIHLQKIENSRYKLGKDIFPNMKNKNDFPWHNAKKLIAEKIKEITLLKDCSVSFRDEKVESGIYDYTKLDHDFIKNKVNFNLQNRKEFLPKCVNTLFIDFEILTSVYDDFKDFPERNTKDYLFNIGCGREVRKRFKFKSYMAHSLKEEYSIIKDFVDDINILEGANITFCHWTSIEKTVLNKKLKQYPKLSINKNIIWLDLHKYFKDNSILVKDCYNYKLKYVARKLREYSVINSKWDSAFADGVGAMTGYIKYLQTKDKKIIDDIAHYNKIDCKVLYEIYKAL